MKPVYLLSMPSGFEWMVILVILGLCLIPFIFYALTLQNTLKQVSVHNQRMPPGNVWLLIIPLFNLVWHFIVVTKISESLEAEYRDRNIPVAPKPTYNIGIAFCILACVNLIPLIGTITSIATLVCWIIYWVQVYNHKQKLQQTTPDF